MLSEIMQKTLKSIPADSSITAAAEKMRQDKISALLVERKGKFIGLLTDTDIVRKGLGAKRNLDQTTPEQLMATDLPSIQVTKTSHDAYDMMGDLGVRHLVICDKDKIVGLVSMRDLLLHFKSYEPSIGVD
ncbi:cyclic nucleotide-binding/CBS domain-containing protein [Candidatus Nitronereus thalassa]|uniref:CBS domain-containing protein n=1 Tax=Candidatus Nitronereus thalassa TaxID=3020898 RepID=A0ABU3K8X7_9BACT|nr:CBS domain-containing protein [Candidatus Nitronereus thalassa]MDT7042817.1 CBS domain-containing protein [Candidatus Nitronereus thalassa]